MFHTHNCYPVSADSPFYLGELDNFHSSGRHFFHEAIRQHFVKWSNDSIIAYDDSDVWPQGIQYPGKFHCDVTTANHYNLSMRNREGEREVWRAAFGIRSYLGRSSREGGKKEGLQWSSYLGRSSSSKNPSLVIPSSAPEEKKQCLFIAGNISSPHMLGTTGDLAESLAESCFEFWSNTEDNDQQILTVL